jgi:hypothetical protein
MSASYQISINFLMTNDRFGGFVHIQTEQFIGKNKFQTTHVYMNEERPLSGS